MSAAIQPTTVTVGQAIELIRLAIRTAERPHARLFIWGSPGVGKSDAVRQAAAAEGISPEHVYDVRASQIDPTTARGVPIGDPTTGIARWTRPDYLPPADLAEPCVILLDELTSAVPSMQGAWYELCQDGRIGTHAVPQRCTIIAAGNRAGIDRSVAYAMSAALANRFPSHVEVLPDVEEWAAWAQATGIDPSIVAFVRWRGSEALLEMPGTGISGRSFATPRSWANLSGLLAGASQLAGRKDGARLVQALIEGAVGPGQGAAFLAFRRVWSDLPDLDVLLMGSRPPASWPTDLEKRADLAYAICAALVDRYRRAGAKRQTVVDRLLELTAPPNGTASILPEEFSVLLGADLARCDGTALVRSRNYKAWNARYREVVL